jgi:hypothetical protein
MKTGKATRAFRNAAYVLGLAAAFTTVEAQVGKNMGLIYPDLATEAELAALPNMTPVLAKWIVDNRPFAGMKAIDDHLKITLDSTKRLALYERMFLPVNLNVQVAQEIAMIPRAFRRMAHEFDEYSPYAALAVWRREIDKYIDPPLLDFLEQYVFVPMNVNAAADSALMTIPGLKQNGLDAIKRGRPWSSEAAFREGVGRTLDAREVQRISRYLLVR